MKETVVILHPNFSKLSISIRQEYTMMVISLNYCIRARLIWRNKEVGLYRRSKVRIINYYSFDYKHLPPTEEYVNTQLN